MDAATEFIRVIEKEITQKLPVWKGLHPSIYYKEQLLKTANDYGNSNYGQYLKKIAEN